MLQTRRTNSPILGIASVLLSGGLALSVLVYFMVMDRLSLGNFNTFEIVSVCVMVIPMVFAFGSLFRRERMWLFSAVGIGVSLFTIAILALMFVANGM